ncbi:MAG: MFS transporter, partial [Proteobacteria bacterium]|nr:MFS transporter [Pseudomonadota bacterium]
TFVTYLPIFLRDTFAANDFMIGIIVGARVVSGAIVGWQYGRISGRFSARPLLSFAYLLMAGGMALVPILPSATSMILISLIYGASFAIIRPAMQVSLLEAAPEHLRSSFAAAHGLALRIAQTIAPVLAGLLLLVGDLDDIYWAGSVCCLLLLLVLLTAKQWNSSAEGRVEDKS